MWPHLRMLFSCPPSWLQTITSPLWNNLFIKHWFQPNWRFGNCKKKTGSQCKILNLYIYFECMGEHTQDMYGSQRTSSLFLGTELTGHQAWWQSIRTAQIWTELRFSCWLFSQIIINSSPPPKGGVCFFSSWFELVLQLALTKRLYK